MLLTQAEASQLAQSVTTIVHPTTRNRKSLRRCAGLPNPPRASEAHQNNKEAAPVKTTHLIRTIARGRAPLLVLALLAALTFGLSVLPRAVAAVHPDPVSA